MANITADEYLDVTKTITSITELVILDRFWTEEAKATGREPERIRGLSTLVDELERLLVEIELRARRSPPWASGAAPTSRRTSRR